MRINKKRISLAKKVKIKFYVNIFTSLTTASVERASAIIEHEIQRGYSITIAAYDWRLALTLKRRYPAIKTNLLLPDLILDPTNTVPTSNFYCRYKKSYLFYQSFYGRDCAWFFTFNPKKYFMDLGALRRATGADRIILTKSCRHASHEKTKDINFFTSYTQYSRLSRERKYPTWNHKFKSHLVSLADYYQLQEYVTLPDARKFLDTVKMAALQAEHTANNNHREGVKTFYNELNKIEKVPSITSFKDFWPYPTALNKISDIYACRGDIDNYLACKKIELNNVLNIHSSTPHMLSDSQLLDAMFNHINKEVARFQFRTRQDDEFTKLISGKSVAIVGPAPNQEKQGQDIDSFDNIVRLRFPEDDPNTAPHVGRKTTIINNSLAFSNLMGDSLNNDDNMYVTYQSAIPKGNRAKHSRTLFELENNLLTMPHAVPRILIDLLAFAPSKIKIFNTTLLLGIKGKSYTANYKQKISAIIESQNIPSADKIRISAFYHDPIVNFLIIKCLYLKYFFEADTVLNEIIKMSLENYLVRFFGEK